MRKRLLKVSLLLGVLLLVAGIVWLIIQFKAQVDKKTLVLPNGNVIEVEGFVIGTNSFTTDTPFNKFARKYLPSPLATWIPPSVTGNFSSDTNSITLYLRHRSPTGAAANAFWQSAKVLDVHGFLFENVGHRGTMGEYYVLNITSFPRRDPEMVIEFYDGNKTLVTSLQLKNPVKGPFPEWKAEALPQTKTNGPVRLSLLSGKNEGTYCSFKTRIESDDPLWSKYGKGLYHLADATGNEGSLLRADEPAWKVLFRCFREEKTPFPSNEVWRVENLAVPAAGTGNVLGLTNTVDGLEIVFLTFCNAAITSITNDKHTAFLPKPAGREHSWSSSSDGVNRVESIGSDCPMILLETDTFDENTEVLFRFRDESGKILRPEHYPSGYTGRMGGRRLYARRLKTDSKTIQVETIVNRGYAFEFMISPKDVSEPKFPVFPTTP